MTTTARDPIYAGYRYPAEIISCAVWLYFRFPLSLRMVEEMLAARGISVTHETIRQWGLKFGREFANQPDLSASASPWRQMAPRRGGRQLRREEALALACRRPGRLRSRCSRPETARQEGRQPPVRKLLKQQGRAPR